MKEYSSIPKEAEHSVHTGPGGQGRASACGKNTILGNLGRPEVRNGGHVEPALGVLATCYNTSHRAQVWARTGGVSTGVMGNSFSKLDRVFFPNAHPVL